jgi:CxxC motif-containing protein (DUF1111 family)
MGWRSLPARPAWLPPALSIALLASGVVCVAVGSAAQLTLTPADNRLGGDLSVVSRTSRAFGQPGPRLSAAELGQFNEGDAAFEATFVAGAAPANSGLGPKYNNASCVACHPGDGRGLPVFGMGPRRSIALVRISADALQDDLSATDGLGIGQQIHDHATFGHQPDATIALQWETQSGTYGDGSSYELRQPRMTITLPDGSALPPTVQTSMRVPPPVFGRGLLETIPEEALLAAADPDDLNGDGISGRPNWIRGDSEPPRIGRFGLKSKCRGPTRSGSRGVLERHGRDEPCLSCA